MPISIVEAVRGGTVEVPTLERTKQIRIPAGTQDGSVQRLRGEGPPKLSGSGRGDIHYRFRIEVPKSLNDEQREAVERLAEVMNGDPRAELLAARAGRGAERWPASRRSRAADLFEETRGVFMISVAAELSGMHPQTLRVYEARGLIKPSRSPKKTRLYSRQDVELLKRIQELTNGVRPQPRRCRAGADARADDGIDARSARGAAAGGRARWSARCSSRSRPCTAPTSASSCAGSRPGKSLRTKDAKPFKIPIERSSSDAT